MSIKRNVLANYTAQIYVTIIGIVLVPVYLRLMGAEAYGLVGFFTMLQAWFNLLDMGLSPTLARETARFRGGATDALTLRRLVRALEMIFVGVAIAGASAVIFFSDRLAGSWLKLESLNLNEVSLVITIMAGVLALRWLSTLYRAAITGYERLVWLSGFNITIATLRFVGVVPVLMFIDATPLTFFTYNLIIAAIELIGLSVFSYRLLPRNNEPLGWSITPVRRILGFSLTLAFTSTVWVAVTQTDKLLLSKMIGLSEYAYFTVAVLLASGINLLAGPIVQAFQPRLAKHAAENDEDGLIRLYRTATQAIATITGSAAIVMAVFAEEVLWLWSGNRYLSENYALVLTFYALGNGFLALAAFPYYLQFARGDMRLHLWGNLVFVIILVPSIIWATKLYGILGAASVWLGSNAVFFLFWTAFVHGRLAPGLHKIWLIRDILPALAIPAALGSLIFFNKDLSLSPIVWVCFITLTSCVMVASACVSSSLLRPSALQALSRLIKRGEGYP